MFTFIKILGAIGAYLFFDLWLMGPVAKAIVWILRWHEEGRYLRLLATSLGLVAGRWESRKSIRRRIYVALSQHAGSGNRAHVQQQVADMLRLESALVTVETLWPGRLRIVVPRNVSERLLRRAEDDLKELLASSVDVTFERRPR